MLVPYSVSASFAVAVLYFGFRSCVFYLQLDNNAAMIVEITCEIALREHCRGLLISYFYVYIENIFICGVILET